MVFLAQPKKLLVENYHVLLIFSYILLVPFSRLAAVPLAVMSFGGVVIFLKRKIDWKNKNNLFYIMIFGCFWGPIIISLPSAVNIIHSGTVALNYLQYLFLGIFIIHFMSGEAGRHKILLRLCSWAIAFWVSDAIFQALTGYNIFGFTYHHGALNGIFGTGHPKMGIYLAALCPLLFVYSGRYWHKMYHFFAIFASTLVVLLAGRRGGWIMLVLVLVGYLAWLIYDKKIKLIFVLLGGLFFLLGTFGTYQMSSQFKERVNTSLLIFEGGYQNIDIAISHRLPIWSISLDIIRDHPLTGIGARGFRYVYRDYADENDLFIQNPESKGALYPHQIILEIFAETGVVGLSSFIVGLFFLVRIWAVSEYRSKIILLPYGLALLAVLFPLNTHYATYSSHWSALIFWCTALYCSSFYQFNDNT